MGKNGNSERLFSWAPKSLQTVTAAMEIKDTCSLKKSYDKPSKQVKKQRHQFADKSSEVKAMVFLVLMYGCESWIIKKAECQRINAFELWCQRRLLRVQWTAKRSNQSIPKDIDPE